MGAWKMQICISINSSTLRTKFLSNFAVLRVFFTILLQRRLAHSILVLLIITGPPTHSVGGRLVTVAGVCHRLSSFVVYHLSSSVTLAYAMQRNLPGGSTHGGPVVLRPVRATPC